MTGSTRRRSTLVTVLAGAFVLALFSTGGAVAGGLITSAQIKNDTIKSKDVRNGTLKGLDVRDGALTGADVANNALSGADIADGSLTNQDVGVLYASVHSTGTLGGSSGGVTVSKLGAGFYTVDFHRDITPCAVSATVADVADEFPVGFVNAGEMTGEPSQLFVGTKSTAGANTDLDFHLVLVC